MIKYWLVTGDTHGKVVERLNRIPSSIYPPEETAIIIMGDVGLNYYLNRTDRINKTKVQNTEYTVYCVRGNHEERPENLNFPLIYDSNVQGFVYQEVGFPKIKYFDDGQVYNIAGLRTLVVGGAYSVDKAYRILRGLSADGWTGWFPEEQLSEIEMQFISDKYKNDTFDLVLSHTCPYSWQPTNLFIDVDLGEIDNTMEFWLEEFKNTIYWKLWLFGHFHGDRIISPGVEMVYEGIQDLKEVYHSHLAMQISSY